MSERPLPPSTIETEAYWDGLKQGELRLPTCQDCGKPHFYPRPFCPHCGSARLNWTRMAGEGAVYSHTTVHRAPSPAFADDVPYVVAIIALAEGPHMMSRLVDVAPDGNYVGAPVRMRVEQRGDGALPVFAMRAP